MLFIPSGLDGDLSELEGGGGTLIYLYYMSNIEAWPIFFLADFFFSFLQYFPPVVSEAPPVKV